MLARHDRGLAHTTALNAGILGAASPVFVTVSAALVLGDRLPLRSRTGIGLGVVAVVLTLLLLPLAAVVEQPWPGGSTPRWDGPSSSTGRGR